MPEPEIICVGMTVVDVLAQGIEALPKLGETGFASGISLAIGGDATNQAVALAKLGNSVGLMGLMGDDVQGAFIRGQCKAQGINIDGIFVDAQRATATGLVLIDTDGERSFLVKRRAAHHEYGLEHINLELIKPGLKILSVGSLFCSEAFDRKAFAPLLRKAKSVGAITIADMVMDQQGYGLDELNEAWPFLDYAMPSEIEGKHLTGSADPHQIAKSFQSRGVKNVIVKQGASGVTAFIGREIHTCPAFKAPVVDTTGAGDNFVGGFVHALTRGVPMDRALRFGSACAALSIQEVGAGAGLKDRRQVEDFLKAN